MSFVSANKDNTTALEYNFDDNSFSDSNTIFVNNEYEGISDGSENNPYSSLNPAISNSYDNSKIIMKEGIYKGDSNTNILINKNLTIEGEGNVIIDGENKNFFFKISPSASLTLKNIKFIRGYTQDYTQLSVIYNSGNLTLNDCTFSNMNSIMPTIFNNNILNLNNTTMTASKSNYYAQNIINLGNCTISHSKLTPDAMYSSSDIPTIYNYNNLYILNSQIDEVESNNKYNEFVYKNPTIFIFDSSFKQVEIDDATITINNSIINNRASFRNSNVHVQDSTFNQQGIHLGLGIYYSNFTSIHSIYNCEISSGYSDINITYSAILNTMFGGGKYDKLYAPYNWWGINSGPVLSYFTNYNISCWAVSTFEYEYSTIPVNPQGIFTVSLNKWTDGQNIREFNPGEELPIRYVRFESQSGEFENSYKALNRQTTNYLIGNNVDGKVYVVIDRQRLTLNVGNALSNNTYYISPEGHDGPEDGSFEKPFLTLQYAVSKVGNGNTICILGGINKNPANSNVIINKNITIVGLGDTTLVRSNDHNMFNIMEWGSLTIKNIKFVVSDRDYTNPIFHISGGSLKIVNSSFKNITSEGVVYTSSGVESKGDVIIEDSVFDNIKGSAVFGVSRTYIFNTTFQRFTNLYHAAGFESFNTIFPVKNSVEIYDSLFKENTIGIVNLNPYYYSRSTLLSAEYGNLKLEGLYAYVENSVFIKNQFNLGSYISSGTGFLINDNYGSFRGYINNCSFIGNDGPIAVATNVDNSIFINNTAIHGSGGLIKANSVFNSIFINNSNIYKDGEGAFVGDGVVVADNVLNSTFEFNRAAFGGAIANAKEVHYCVFVNNSAKYGGNDIFSASGDVDYSTNWWGDNQKPNSDKIYKFLGTLTVSDWVIMSLEYSSNKEIKASLTKSVDNNGNIKSISNFPHKRLVSFSIDNGIISPEITYLNNGIAYAILNSDFNNDFKAYARIDNQLLEVNVRNTHTNIIIEDTIFKGKSNKYSVTLVNVNGYKISNQTLLVEVNGDSFNQIFTIVTDEEGHAEFNVDYPIGVYNLSVKYLGNGYFIKSSANAKIEVVVSMTALISYDHVYYGKNNRFSAILTGENENKLSNLTLTFTITDSQGHSTVLTAKTDNYGIGEILLVLEIGEYDILTEFKGDSWYSYSYSTAHIIVNPVNTTIIAPDITFYGDGNQYNITLKDIYGNIVSEENIYLTISQNGINDKFTLKTNEFGVASLTINYLPGTYYLHIDYNGDEVYGASKSDAVIKIEKVLTVLSGFSHTTIPIGGVYTVILSDMYGKRVNGEKITLNIYKGNLIKQYVLECDANGEASFKIDLGEGTYLATIDYEGNLWYSDSTNAATIVVSNDVKLQDISINGSDLVQYYGEDKYFIIKFNDPNAYSQYGKNIAVTLSSGTWSSSYTLNTDVYGLARLKITLNPGEYNITYKYANNYYGLFASGSNKINVYKTPTKIYAKDLVITKDESRIFEIELRDINNSPIKNMQIFVDIDGVKQNITTNAAGIGKLVLNLGVGEHIISYGINNPNYLPSNASSKVLVVDSDKTSSSIISDDAVLLDNQTLNYKIILNDILGNGISSSLISIQISTFDGESILNKTGFTNSDGSLIFNLDLEYGKYVVVIVYDGNDLYLPSSQTNTINVESSDGKTKSIIFSGNEEVLSSTDYFIVLSDINGTLLKNKKIKFMIGNEMYNITTNNEGRAYLNADLSPNVYTIKTIFEGDDEYKKSSLTSKLFISGKFTQILTIPLIKYYLNGTQFHAKLIDSLQNPISGKNISILLQNKIYNCTTDENGWITLEIDLTPGKYEVECYYYGNVESENSFNRTTITVLSTVYGQDEAKFYGESPYLMISFVDGAGKPINNTPFIVGIDGANYYAITNYEGKFLFDLNLDPGKHIISVVNPYDGLLVNYNLEIFSTVFANNMIKVIYSNICYEAYFLDKDGTPLANHEVSIVINGYKYVYKTDKNGNLNLDFNLKPGKYLVTAINPVTGQYVENNVEVLSSIVENKDVIMYFNNGDSYKVRIIGFDGKAVGSGVEVLFKVNGKSYKIKTNSEGYAIFKIKLKPNKYTVSATYNSYSVFNKITVKPILTAKNISKKKSKSIKFKAKLVNGQGNALKNKKITFKIKSNKYSAKTNKKGFATIKIRNLQVGNYKIKSIYGKSKITNKIKIRR